MKERLLLVLTIVGFVVPNIFVGLFFAREGFDPGGYFSSWTASIRPLSCCSTWPSPH